MVLVFLLLVVERLKCNVNAKRNLEFVFQITKITEDSSFAVSRNGLLLGDSQGRTAEVHGVVLIEKYWMQSLIFCSENRKHGWYMDTVG